MSTAEKTEAPEILVVPFGVEVDHPRNDTVLLQSLPGVRLRSAISGMKGAVSPKGEYQVPLDQARGLASFPATPGMQIHINPSRRSYAIIDPLNDNPEMLERITRFMRQRQGVSGTTIKGVPNSQGEVDQHTIKTLCREIIWLLQAGDVKVIKGPTPELAEVDALPGDYLLNPGAQVQNTQPRYEKDWDAWVSNLTRQGG